MEENGLKVIEPGIGQDPFFQQIVGGGYDYLVPGIDVIEPPEEPNISEITTTGKTVEPTVDPLDEGTGVRRVVCVTLGDEY